MGKVILLVEDQDDMALVTKMVLEDAGHLVIWANRGDVAIDKAFKHRFDIVLLDLGMPDMSGEDIGLQLLALQPDMQVIILSAMPPYQLKKAADKLNGIYLFKPITPAMLLKAVQPCNENVFFNKVKPSASPN